MIYSLKVLKGKTHYYYGTSRLYLQAAPSHLLAMNGACNESKNSTSVGVYLESDNTPLQMVRSYKGGAVEYVSQKIQTK
jgi:hypothetical protein